MRVCHRDKLVSQRLLLTDADGFGTVGRLLQ